MDINEKQFSRKYIEILEDVLHTERDPSVRPNPESQVEELDRRLNSHFSVWQRGALESIREQNRSTVFHFGNSDQLSTTLDYAPLYVDHVVLQDLVHRQLQFRTSPEKKLMRIRPIAEEILSWKTLVEEGRMSIVPAPSYWDSRIEEQQAELEPSRRLFSSPLYASLLLNVKPFTDVPSLKRKLPKMAKGTIGREIAKISVEQTAVVPDDSLIDDPTYYQNEMANLGHDDVFDLLPNLLGNPNGRRTPELWCLRDPDPEQLHELSERFSGFRDRINETIRDIESVKNESEIGEIAEAASEELTREYEMIQEQRLQFRDEIGKQALRVVLQSIPIIVGMTHQDMLIGMLNASANGGLAGIELHKLYEKWTAEPPGTNNAVFQVFNYFEHH